MTDPTIKGLFSKINGMEDYLNRVQWLTMTVRHLGQSASLIEPEAVFALGEVLEDSAEQLKVQWQEAHRMAAALRREGD